MSTMSVEERKARGAYYTGKSVADLLVAAALRDPSDRVLEPCCGDGVFLQAHRDQFGDGDLLGPVVGVDVDPEAARLSAAAFPHATIHCRDFLEIEPGELGLFQAVVGNPPFVRYHRYRGGQRELGLRRCREAGVRVPALTSAWVPFLVHATRHLAPGGRMAVVVPMELTYARYAKPFIEYLLAHFAQVRVLEFDEPLFPQLNESTGLLLAAGWGGSASSVQLMHVRRPEDVDPRAIWTAPAHSVPLSAWTVRDDRSSLYRMNADARRLYEDLSLRCVPLGEVADLTIGYVTGANGWFHLNGASVERNGLAQDVVAIVRRAGDLCGAGLRIDGPGDLVLREDAANWLFAPTEPLSRSASRYIARGESVGVHMAHKCRSRQPWWRVPGVRSHDFLMPVLSSDWPRVVACALPATNSLLVGDLREPMRPDLVAAASLTSLAALSAEVTGHALGGGALKMEPSEARRWLLPLAVDVADDALAAIDGLLRGGRQKEAMCLADDAFLRDGLGMSEADMAEIRRAADHLRRLRKRGRRADRS